MVGLPLTANRDIRQVLSRALAGRDPVLPGPLLQHHLIILAPEGSCCRRANQGSESPAACQHHTVSGRPSGVAFW